MNNRKSNRLKNYDYSENGMYFVTICTQDQVCFFGDIINEEMVLNDAGEIISRCLQKIPKYFSNIRLDENIIMPNHIHLIIEILPDMNVGADLVSARFLSARKNPEQIGQTQGLSLRRKNSIGLLSQIVQKFKSKSSVEYIRFMKSKNMPCLTKIWQRSFYDRIIRNHDELNRIREYIYLNPQNWKSDRNNAENIFM